MKSLFQCDIRHRPARLRPKLEEPVQLGRVHGGGSICGVDRQVAPDLGHPKDEPARAQLRWLPGHSLRLQAFQTHPPPGVGGPLGLQRSAFQGGVGGKVWKEPTFLLRIWRVEQVQPLINAQIRRKTEYQICFPRQVLFKDR